MSLYKTLGVRANARPEVIRAAYKKLMQRYHPDKHAGDPAAGRKAQQISEAFQILSDPAARAKYDAEHHGRFAWVLGHMPHASRPAAVKAALLLVLLAAMAAAGTAVYKRYEQQQRAAQQEMAQRQALLLARQQAAERKRQEGEALARLAAAAQAEAQARAQRTIPIFPAHRFVAIRDNASVQGFILPPVDVYIGKESSEAIVSDIAQRRTGLRKAVLKELAQIPAKDLTVHAAEEAVSASILRALNDSLFGRDREGHLCRRDFDEYICHGIETVIFRGSVELVPG